MKWRSQPDPGPAAVSLRAGAPVQTGWHRTYRLGEVCVIPLESPDPLAESRVFLEHDGILYLQELTGWGRRTEIRFLPEAPGSYIVVIEWRDQNGGTGRAEASFTVSHTAGGDCSPRLIALDRKTRFWVPSQWQAEMAVMHEPAAVASAKKVLREGAVIYDIGANLGLFSVLLSRHAGPQARVYAFEANPVCVYFLQANLALNSVPSYEILPMALLGSTGDVEFRINYRNLLVGFAGEARFLDKPGHGIRVGAMSLDAALERYQLRPPDFIKIDIEGAEGEAIAGMRQTIERYRPSMLIEIHGRNAARAVAEAVDWSSYRFEEVSGGARFDDAQALLEWFPEACLQVVATRR